MGNSPSMNPEAGVARGSKSNADQWMAKMPDIKQKPSGTSTAKWVWEWGQKNGMTATDFKDLMLNRAQYGKDAVLGKITDHDLRYISMNLGAKDAYDIETAAASDYGKNAGGYQTENGGLDTANRFDFTSRDPEQTWARANVAGASQVYTFNPADESYKKGLNTDGSQWGLLFAGDPVGNYSYAKERMYSDQIMARMQVDSRPPGMSMAEFAYNWVKTNGYTSKDYYYLMMNRARYGKDAVLGPITDADATFLKKVMGKDKQAWKSILNTNDNGLANEHSMTSPAGADVNGSTETREGAAADAASADADAAAILIGQGKDPKTGKNTPLQDAINAADDARKAAEEDAKRAAAEAAAAAAAEKKRQDDEAAAAQSKYDRYRRAYLYDPSRHGEIRGVKRKPIDTPQYVGYRAPRVGPVVQ